MYHAGLLIRMYKVTAISDRNKQVRTAWRKKMRVLPESKALETFFIKIGFGFFDD
jgi:hypothetical protein